MIHTSALLRDGRNPMELTVYFEKEQSTKKIKFSGQTVEQLLHFLKINSEIILVTRKNEILTLDEKLKHKDKLEILSVVSGG